MKRLSLVPVVVLALACSASDKESIERRASSIAGGSADTEHDSVFIMVSHNDQSGSVCTATLIAPNLLLTARHCISAGERRDIVCGASELGEPYPGSSIYASNAAVPDMDSRYFQGLDIRVPVQGADTCGFDVALVILAENVPSVVAVPAIPRIDREVVQGETYTAVGYGADETGEPTGRREMRSGLRVECSPGLCGFGVESTEFRGETGICSGDSGGPALDVDGKVVGVVSRGGTGCGSPVYGTVTAWRDWISDVAAEAAELGGYPAPFWVLSGKSDPPGSDPPDGGSAGSGPGPTLGGQGESCQSPAQCLPEHACFSVDGTTTSGVCVALCEDTSECADGLVCSDVGGTGVCLEPSKPADDGGCRLAAGQPRSSSPWPGFALLALSAAWLGRARRRSRPVTRG